MRDLLIHHNVIYEWSFFMDVCIFIMTMFLSLVDFIKEDLLLTLYMYVNSVIITYSTYL